MQILTAFSIADFLAYLFPGVLSLSGIYAILLLTPFRSNISLPQDAGSSLIFLIFSCVTGVLVSTFVEIIYREISNSKRRKLNKGNIQLHDEELKNAVVVAFNKMFFSQNTNSSMGKRKSKNIASSDWNEDYYYVCRSLVTELMPRAGASGLREGAYRQLRMNLIGSIMIWELAGILWGVIMLFQPDFIFENFGNNISIDHYWWIGLIVFSVLFGSLLINTFQKLMDKHEQREVREILTSFLAGYEAGIFDKRKQ